MYAGIIIYYTFLKSNGGIVSKILYSVCLSLIFWGPQAVVAKDSNKALTSASSYTIKENEIIMKNKQKFALLKKYNLPTGKYAIGGSGPLGIRGIREIHDIDILVSDDLRDDLIKKYSMVDDGKIKKIVFPKDDIEVFWEGSFYTQKNDPHDPKVKDIIKRADIIDGLPFESLDDSIYFKRKMGRPKDLEDIKLMEKWRREH